MDKERIELLKECMRKLVANTIWLLSVILIALLAFVVKTDKINIGSLTINATTAGWYFIAITSVISVAIIKNYLSSISIYKQIESPENKAIAQVFLNSYPSVINPYTDGEGHFVIKIINNAGYSIISLSSVIGLLAGIIVMEPFGILTTVILLIIISVYFVIRYLQYVTETGILNNICVKTYRAKRIMFRVNAAILLCIIFIQIYRNLMLTI